jgi:hypothetical protein
MGSFGLKEFVVLQARFIHCIHPSQYIKVIKYYLDPPLFRLGSPLSLFDRVKLACPCVREALG